jgi:hypothetical protein
MNLYYVLSLLLTQLFIGKGGDGETGFLSEGFDANKK